MRTIDKPCPPALGKNDTIPYPETTSQSYTIKVITPLFGGGVEAGVNDPVTLIRPSSIRGHLRFWWRATRGAWQAHYVFLKVADCWRISSGY